MIPSVANVGSAKMKIILGLFRSSHNWQGGCIFWTQDHCGYRCGHCPDVCYCKNKLNEGRPVIEGLSHIMFIVRDLDKMEDILMKVLDAKRIYNSDDRTYSLSSERFFLMLVLSGW